MKTTLIVLAAVAVAAVGLLFVRERNQSRNLQLSDPVSMKVGDATHITLFGGKAKQWTVLPKKGLYVTATPTSMAVLAQLPGTYMVTARDGDKMAQTTVTVTGVGKADEPAKPKSIIHQLMAEVESEAKNVEAMRLARSFRSVADLIDDGLLETPEDIVLATKHGNLIALGESKVKWTAFLFGMRRKLGHLHKEGKLETPEAHAKLWRQVADLLEDAAKHGNLIALGESKVKWTAFLFGMRRKLGQLHKEGKLETPEAHAKLWRQVADRLEDAASQ